LFKNDSVTVLLAPIPRPPKLICIGLNYRDHAAESARGQAARRRLGPMAQFFIGRPIVAIVIAILTVMLGAFSLLRLSFAGDIAAGVRDASGRALGRLGDADSVESFCAALYRRDDDREAARTAAYALGYLGDVRAVDALVAAYEAGWLPDVIAEALGALGGAALPLLVETIEGNPELMKRSTARRVFDQLAADVLEPVLVARITEVASAADFVARASVLLDIVKDRAELTRTIGAHILRVRPDLRSATSRQDRALVRKADARATS
jgi:hypothetical protein